MSRDMEGLEREVTDRPAVDLGAVGGIGSPLPCAAGWGSGEQAPQSGVAGGTSTSSGHIHFGIGAWLGGTRLRRRSVPSVERHGWRRASVPRRGARWVGL
jgi:hypothetical protein